MVRAFLFLGVPRGLLFPMTIWSSYMWMKTVGYSNTVVGLCGLLAVPSLLKLPFFPYLLRVQWGRLFGLCNKAGLLCFFALLCSSAVIMAALFTPCNLLPFLICMSIAAFSTSVIETALEVLRLDSASFSVPGMHSDWVASQLGTGDRIGCLLGNPLLLLMVSFSSWTVALCVLAVLFLLFISAVRSLNALWALEEEETRKSSIDVMSALRDLFCRWGYVVYTLPCLMLLSEALVRPMIGVMLLDRGFSLREISLGYGISYVGGVFGARCMLRFFPARANATRLYWSGSINSLMSASYSLLWMWPSTTACMILMFCSGWTQSVFLLFVRISLGDLCSRSYQFIQMAFFLSLWVAMAIFSTLAGWLSSVVEWRYYFVIVGIIFVPCGYFASVILKKTRVKAS